MNTYNNETTLETKADNASLIGAAKIAYGLQALSFFLGITIFISIIISYIKRGDAKGSWLESHFTWQIRTFWFGLLWGVIGGITIIFGVGYFVLLADLGWMIYRIIKGWLNLNDQKAV